MDNKLKKLISREINKQNIDLDNIMSIICDYEKNNLNKIKELNREKRITHRRISGGIKNFLHAHPKLTHNLIPSLTKRIYGNLLLPIKEKETLTKKILKWIKMKLLN